jgi:hypothetical protein
VPPIDGDWLAAALLRRVPAAFAHRQCHLIRAAPGVAFFAAREHGLGQGAHERVVVEPMPATLGQRPARLAQHRVRFGREAEGDAFGLGARFARIGGAVALGVPRHEALDLPRRAAVGGLEPVALGVGRGDARHLADDRVQDRALFEGLGQQRQMFERLGGANALFGGAPGEVEHSLGVCAKAAVAVEAMDAQAEALQEPAPQLGLMG